jgi:probable F420-dependent oxidoreductase
MSEPLSVRVGVGWNPLDRDGSGERFWETVEMLEADGWDSLWLSDSATRGGVAPLPMLAAVAARTERLKLGTSVLAVAARSPVLLAKELATIDVISRGRLFPAFGTGVAQPAELEALGVVREERGARLEECLAIVRALWSGEPVDYEGRFSRFTGVTLTPRPTRSVIEPWLGGSTEAAARRVGRIADGWLASGVSPDAFGSLVQVIRDQASECGRAVPEDHFGTILLVAAEDADVDRVGRSALVRRARESGTVAIGADQVRDRLERFRAGGATKFVLYLLAADPRPLLRELKSAVVDPLEAAPVLR